MRNFTIIIAIVLFSSIYGKENTIRQGALTSANNEEYVNCITDTTNISNDIYFDKSGLSIKGYGKKISANNESFIVTNNTNYNISRFELLLRYSDLKGNVIHERTCMVECDLPMKATREVSISTFDKQKRFYYYNGPKPKRTVGTQFKVAFKLLRYDIIAK